MQPSSLIFVLVVAIWAVFLLGHWSKRRDHLATVRSADRFSDAMRILGEGRMTRTADHGSSSAYGATPTRAARPETEAAPEVDDEATGPGRRLRLPEATRRVRGLTFLATVVLLPVMLLVAAFGPLPWWAPLAWLVPVAGSFVWLRRRVVAERATRAPQRPVHAPAPRRQRETERPAARPAEPEATVEAPTAPERRSQFYDITEDEPAAPVAQAAPQPGTWQPTPVPRPTYTMKAKAAPAPATPSVPQQHPLPDVPQVIDVEDEELPEVIGWR